MDIEDLIPREDCVFTLTNMGYIKRMPVDTYQQQRRGGRGVKGMTRREEDVAQTMFTCSTHDSILFFTTAGKAYRVKGYEIPEASRTGKGMNIVNILPITAEEKVSAMIRMPEQQENSFLCMITRKGVVKRSDLYAFRNIRKNGLIAVHLDEGDELAEVFVTGGSDDILVATRNGMSIRFNELDIRSMGRTARGVKALKLKGDDIVVGMVRLVEGQTVLTVTETGYGRRTPIGDYRLQSRGGSGTINYQTKKYGKVASVAMVTGEEDLVLISSDGIIIRIPAESVNVHFRTSKGVRVMRVNDGERVATVTVLAHEAQEDDEADEADETTDGSQAEPASDETNVE